MSKAAMLGEDGNLINQRQVIDMAKSIQERKAELEAQLAKIKEEEKAQDAQKAAIIGRLVFEKMKTDSAVNSQVQQLISANLKKKSERELFGLSPLPSKRGRPAIEVEPQ